MCIYTYISMYVYIYIYIYMYIVSAFRPADKPRIQRGSSAGQARVQCGFRSSTGLHSISLVRAYICVYIYIYTYIYI